MANPNARIRIRGKNFDFSCPLGNGPAIVTGGGAEYEAGRRPQSDAVTLFQGNALLAVDVPVLFDGYREKRDVWPQVERVLALCRGVERRPPPDFIATGPIPYSNTRFQMSMPEWGDGLRSRSGLLIRQALVLKLVEYNDPTSIRFKKRYKQGLSKDNRVVDAPPSITLNRPTSLLEIAVEFFHNADEATRIGRLNGIDDIRKKLKPGRRIKLGTSPVETNLDV